MDNLAAPNLSPTSQSPVKPGVFSLAESPNRRWLLWLSSGLAILTLGITIGIFGAKFLNQSQGQSQFTQTPAPELPAQTLTQTPTADPTANWKTYTNTNNDISFKYPETWTITQGNSNAPTYPKDTIVLKSIPSSFDVSFVVQNNSLNITPKDILLNFVKNSYGDIQTQITNQTDLTASGYITQSGPQNSQLTITIKVVTNNQKNLIATTILQADKINIFDQILSTFKFLDQNE